MTVSLTTPRERATPVRVRMSHPNRFAAVPPCAARTARRAGRDGRRVGDRRPSDRAACRPAARPAAGASLDRLTRPEFSRRWSLLMIASFGSREACAVHFEATFQTACNWFDGHCRPYGDQVVHAWRTLPRFAEVMGG